MRQARPSQRPAILIPHLICAILALGCIACGDRRSPDLVASVGTTAISGAELEQWARYETIAGTSTTTFRPPRYTSCVSAKRAWAKRHAFTIRIGPFRSACRREALAALRHIIEIEWIHREAKFRHVAVTRHLLVATLRAQRSTLTHTAHGRRLIQRVGSLRAVVAIQHRLDASSLLRTSLTNRAATVSARSIREYFYSHRGRFAVPARRDVRLFLAVNRPRAERALRALKNGDTWHHIIAQYGHPNRLSSYGTHTVDANNGDESLERAIFRARTNTILGPVHTQFGWYVFEVLSVHPRASQPLAPFVDFIREILQERTRSKFVAKYRRDTHCAPGYALSLCDNSSARGFVPYR